MNHTNPTPGSPSDANLPQIAVRVPTMVCRHDVRDVTARLRDVAGVQRVTAEAATATVTVEGSVTWRALLEALAASGHPGAAVAGRPTEPTD